MALNANRSHLITILVLISLVIISGCVSREPKDCGSDESCFAEAVESCSLATARTMDKIETFGGVETRYVISASVKGPEEGSCVVEINVAELAMTGNLTQAPARLIYLLYSLVDSPISCQLTDAPDIDISGIRSIAGHCTGSMLDNLEEAFTYEEGEHTNVSPRRIEVLESFCVGGEKIVGYIRNVGTETLNISMDISIVNARDKSEVHVDWRDFSGGAVLKELLPYKMAQFNIQTVPGTLYSHEIILDSQPHTVSTQC